MGKMGLVMPRVLAMLTVAGTPMAIIRRTAGTLREWAKALGESEAHELLSEILDQEKAANHKLTHIAITTINKPDK